MSDIKGRRVAVLATDGVEQVELTEPVKALREAGAKVDVISPKDGDIQGMNHHDMGDKLKVDVGLKDARADDYDALVLPGGVANPDTICHGPWTLIDAGGVKGKRVTSWPSLKQDLTNAGASWSDEPVVKDKLLVTSRKPDDLPQFNRAMIELFAV